MTLSELAKRLDSTGLQVTYWAWPEGEAPALPWICYLCEGSSNLFADGGVYHQTTEVVVELYTKDKEPDMEAKVEAVLHDFHWKKEEDYISTERCYQIRYEIEV